MNDIWSRFIQGTNTLYFSRKLRFDDMFRDQYKSVLEIEEDKPIKILEIGCGPGALAAALHRWYPKAKITAIDRDSEFTKFAKEHEVGIDFLEGDATALPFEDGTFDITISHTVSEHIEPCAFYSEQMRVLKDGGHCIVLSSRKGITIPPACTAPDEFENKFWQRAQSYDDSYEKYSICKYPMSEAELPREFEKQGFKNINTGYVTIDLTPDSPKFPARMAYDIINSDRICSLDAIESVSYSMPKHFTEEEIEEMRRRTNAKYDLRIAQYNSKDKQWDTCVSIIMVVRGEK